MRKILIIIDDIEFKYFEFNQLVTNFWLIHEFLLRQYNVFVSLKSKLFLSNSIPFAQCYKTEIVNNDIVKDLESTTLNLNELDIIFFRPDPPLDNDYINASHVLSYVDEQLVLIMNSPCAIRNKNEKIYVNEFSSIAPKNVVSADEKIIKQFLFENKEIIIKPTNLCFGSGVFYLNDKDKNINSILKTATNNYKTHVMVQEYLPGIKNGDKRLIYVCGKIYDYCVLKVASNDDFKFNEHNSSTLKFATLTQQEKQIENIVKDKFEQDGIYLAGLDVIDGKVIEINITSPCFFIKEINDIFKINFEKMIVDRIEEYLKARQIKKLACC